jgi:hypothetical protein
MGWLLVRRRWVSLLVGIGLWLRIWLLRWLWWLWWLWWIHRLADPFCVACGVCAARHNLAPAAPLVCYESRSIIEPPPSRSVYHTMRRDGAGSEGGE